MNQKREIHRRGTLLILLAVLAGILGIVPGFVTVAYGHQHLGGGSVTPPQQGSAPSLDPQGAPSLRAAPAAGQNPPAAPPLRPAPAASGNRSGSGLDPQGPSTAATDGEYVIGVDDVLRIQVWDYKELDQVVPVRPDGKISFPLVGEVRAVGLTASQITEVLTERLGRTLKNPNVSVVIQEIRSLRVFFVGQVTRPGVYPIKQGTPLLQALTLAGGTPPTADLSGSYIIRGRERIPVDLRRLMQDADLSQNIPLQTDDTIVVPEGGEVQNSVFIMGEVLKPGPYPRTEALTLMKLISMAGGFTRFAAPGRIAVIREDGAQVANGERKANQKIRLKIDLNAIQRDPRANPDVSLKPGDVVIVPQTLF